MNKTRTFRINSISFGLRSKNGSRGRPRKEPDKGSSILLMMRLRD